MNKRYVVCDGWHESKSLDCDFKVENGMITYAMGITHVLPKYAYNSKGYRVDNVKYSNRYNYKWC